MAYQGEWGTFVHIPKCGGYGLRRYLRKHLDGGKELAPYHGVPMKVENAFTVVRHPISWLRSYWAYRNNSKWEVRFNKDQRINHVMNWAQIFGLTQWMAGMSWDEVVERLDFDVVSCIYGMYRHPAVKVYQLERIDELLADLGIPNELPVTHVTPGKPTVTDEQQEKLERVLWRSIVEYGYGQINDANYLAEIVDLKRTIKVMYYSAT